MMELSAPSSKPLTEAGSLKPTGKSLSISLAGKCRQKLWLEYHGYTSEPNTPLQERTFDYGDAIEHLLFETLDVPSAHDPGGVKTLGGWWYKTTELIEPTLGLRFNPSITRIWGRQREVHLGKHSGHIDRMGEITFTAADGQTITGLTVIDSKSANANTYRNACKNVLTEDVFSREWVISQQGYMKALQDEGEPVAWSIMVYVNKETGPMMFRFIPYDEQLAKEGLERLASAELPSEPAPDYLWYSGLPIPMRCGYCEFKYRCGEVRGKPLGEPIWQKGRPKWIVP